MTQQVIPTEQKTVQFYGDELLAVRIDDNQIYVAIGQMCDALGIDRASQVRRIRNDEVLAAGYQGSVNLTYPDGGTQASGVLRVDLVPLWLTGLRIKAVREELRAKLTLFKKEAGKVLWEAFQEGRLTADPAFSELLERDTEAVQSYKMLQALLKMARQQVLIEARLETQAGRLDEHERRLESLETAVSRPNRNISEAQASQISQTVKTVAMALGKKSGRNEYGGVYGELYRRYSISSYKLLPLSKFDDAMAWLTEWHQATIGDEPF